MPSLFQETVFYKNLYATPADWQPGQDVIVGLALNDDAARDKFGALDIKLPYLRTTKAPR